MLLMALITFFAVLIAALIGQAIRSAMNSGKSTNIPLNNNYPNQSLVLYQLGQNNLPIYVSKNNQQMGPFPPEQVLQMLNTGMISPFDMAIRQGDNQWQPLNMYFAVK